MFECSSGTGIRQYNLDGLVGCLYVSTHGCLAVVGKSYEHQPPQLPNLEYGGTCVFLSTLGSIFLLKPLLWFPVQCFSKAEFKDLCWAGCVKLI